MKNVRIALSAIAVVAVLGGALAFKTNKTAITIYQCDQAANKCIFDKTVAQVSTTSKPGFTELTNVGTTAPVPGETCLVNSCLNTLWVLGE